MIYDRLTVTLLTMLGNEERDSVNAHIARYLLAHAGEGDALTVTGLASACHVGTGSVSRFALAAGFSSFAELRDAFATFARSYERIEPARGRTTSQELALRMATSIVQVERSIDRTALERLVDDLEAYDHIMAFGLLKAQGAALGLQVDLLMQGKAVQTSSLVQEQFSRIAHASAEDLVVVFSYTGSYFDYTNLEPALRRFDRPRIWVVCGGEKSQPPFVYGCLRFASDGSQAGHPYSLQYAASLIAQELARR